MSDAPPLIAKYSVVKLLIGSPLMLVEDVRDDLARCVWFNGASPMRGTFPLEALRLATQEERDAAAAPKP